MKNGYRHCMRCNKDRRLRDFATAQRRVCDICWPGERITAEQKLLPAYERHKARVLNAYHSSRPPPPQVAKPKLSPTRHCIYCQRERAYTLFNDETHDQCDVCAIPRPLPVSAFAELDAMQHEDLMIRVRRAQKARVEDQQEREHAEKLLKRQATRWKKATRMIAPRRTKSKLVLGLPET